MKNLEAGSSSNSNETSALPTASEVIAASRTTDDVEEEDYSGSNKHDLWTSVPKRRKAREVIKGTKKNNGSLVAACEYHDVYIGRCNRSVASDIVEDYTKNEIVIDIMSCLRISRDTANVRAFIRSVYYEDYEKVLDASMWPENVHVRAYLKNVYYNYNNNGRRY